MTKLSLDGEDDHESDKSKHRIANISIKEQESSPSPSPMSRRRGHKRSFEGNDIPRARGEIFETLADTPILSSFHIPEHPSPTAMPKCSPTVFFGASIRPSPDSCVKPSLLSGTSTQSPVATLSRGSSMRLKLEPIAKKYRPRDSGVGGLGDDDEEQESEDALGPLATRPDNLLYSMDSEDSGLVTPSLEPSTRSAWPLAGGEQGDVDEFIMKALAARGAPPKDKKAMPGTPVKRNPYAHSRPWMTSSKVMPPPAMPHPGGGG